MVLHSRVSTSLRALCIRFRKKNTQSIKDTNRQWSHLRFPPSTISFLFLHFYFCVKCLVVQEYLRSFERSRYFSFCESAAALLPVKLGKRKEKGTAWLIACNTTGWSVFFSCLKKILTLAFGWEMHRWALKARMSAASKSWPLRICDVTLKSYHILENVESKGCVAEFFISAHLWLG